MKSKKKKSSKTPSSNSSLTSSSSSSRTDVSCDPLESREQRASPFASAHLDELLRDLKKEGPRTKGVTREAEKEKSEAGKRLSSSGLLDFESVLRPDVKKGIFDRAVEGVDSAEDTAKAVKSKEGAEQIDDLSRPSRKRHANLPAVVRKYMKMSRNNFEDIDEGRKDVEKKDVGEIDSKNDDDSKSSTRIKVKRKIATQRSKQRQKLVASRSCLAVAKRERSPSSAFAIFSKLTHSVSPKKTPEKFSLNSDSICARSRPYRPWKPDADSRLESAESLRRSREIAVEGILDRDLGTHGELVHLRRAGGNGLCLLHLHCGDPGWRTKKRKIVATLVGNLCALRRGCEFVGFFKVGRWEIEAEVDVEGKAKRPGADALPREPHEALDGLIDVVFARILKTDFVEDDNGVVRDVENRVESKLKRSSSRDAVKSKSSVVEKLKNVDDINRLKPPDESEPSHKKLKMIQRLFDSPALRRTISVSVPAPFDAADGNAIRRRRLRSVGAQVRTFLHSQANHVIEGGTLVAAVMLGLSPCDPVAMVEDIMKTGNGNEERAYKIDRASQASCSLDPLDSESASTREKLVMILGTTADSPSGDLDPPLIATLPSLFDFSPQIESCFSVFDRVLGIPAPLVGRATPVVGGAAPGVGRAATMIGGAAPGIRVAPPVISRAAPVIVGSTSMAVGARPQFGGAAWNFRQTAPLILSGASPVASVKKNLPNIVSFSPRASFTTSPSDLPPILPKATSLPFKILPGGFLQFPPGVNVVIDNQNPASPSTASIQLSNESQKTSSASPIVINNYGSMTPLIRPVIPPGVTLATAPTFNVVNKATSTGKAACETAVAPNLFERPSLPKLVRGLTTSGLFPRASKAVVEIVGAEVEILDDPKTLSLVEATAPTIRSNINPESLGNSQRRDFQAEAALSKLARFPVNSRSSFIPLSSASSFPAPSPTGVFQNILLRQSSLPLKPQEALASSSSSSSAFSRPESVAASSSLAPIETSEIQIETVWGGAGISHGDAGASYGAEAASLKGSLSDSSTSIYSRGSDVVSTATATSGDVDDPVVIL